MSKDRRIHHVGIVVDDIDQAKGFLQGILDIAVDDVIDLGPGKVAWAPCGEIQIELIEYSDPEYKRKRLGSSEAVIEHICFHTDDADAEYAELAEKGVQFTGPPKAWNDRKAFFTTAASCDGVMYQFREPIEEAAAPAANDHR
ncbi:VOC family protein [Pseudonocardia lutea]|uniref:VOC family protein n=1 Tax=Pseudonocardia lutea TaxID=2172015 RepID=A0ABW1I731_9PSEU